MDSSAALIENLLQTSGLSLDDLLIKLQQYKSVKQSVPCEPDKTSTSRTRDNEQENTSNDKSVILETQSSTVNNNEAIVDNESQKESCSSSDNVSVGANAEPSDFNDSKIVLNNSDSVVDNKKSEEKLSTVTTEEKKVEQDNSAAGILPENVELANNHGSTQDTVTEDQTCTTDSILTSNDFVGDHSVVVNKDQPSIVSNCEKSQFFTEEKSTIDPSVENIGTIVNHCEESVDEAKLISDNQSSSEDTATTTYEESTVLLEEESTWEHVEEKKLSIVAKDQSSTEELTSVVILGEKAKLTPHQSSAHSSIDIDGEISAAANENQPTLLQEKANVAIREEGILEKPSTGDSEEKPSTENVESVDKSLVKKTSAALPVPVPEQSLTESIFFNSKSLESYELNKSVVEEKSTESTKPTVTYRRKTKMTDILLMNLENRFVREQDALETKESTFTGFEENSTSTTDPIGDKISQKSVEFDEDSQTIVHCFPKNRRTSDHDYSNFSENLNMDQETSTNDVVQLPKTNDLDLDTETTSSIDDINKSGDSLRNILRMQLSSLRNMKKSSGYLPDLKNRSMFFHNLKKKRKSCDVNTPEQTIEDTIGKEENNNKDNKEVSATENEDSVVSLSDQTDFVILNVTGGIDRLTPELPEEKNEERRFAAVSSTSSENLENTQNKVNSDLEATPSVSGVVSPRKEIKNILTNYRRKMSLNYFDASRYNFLTPKKEQPAALTVKKNISDKFNDDPGINKLTKNTEKSPFVSDSLEDFLNESAQLKISYAIPKLGAEEGIKESQKESPYDSVVNKTSKVETITEAESTPKEKPKLIKAKTLAEMRRQYEKLNAKEESSPQPHHRKKYTSKHSMAKTTESIDIGTTTTTPKTSQNKSRSSEISSHRNCFVLYNNKKVWVASKDKNKCYAIIDTKNSKPKVTTPSKPEPELTSSKKLSLLSALKQQKSCKIKYKPGPLCKKAQLQNTESKDRWITELKTLPEIFLEVVPEVDKAVDPKVAHLLPVFDDVTISEERTDFALSVLKVKNQTAEPKSFKFHIPYNNRQEQMVVRRRFYPPLVPKVAQSEKDPDTVISSILKDIISYVEVKEIEDTLIKDDDSVEKNIDEKLTESPNKAKIRVKKRKLDRELRRLNCKVIDVATEETETKECSKPFCRLGCVCKSLLCESVFSNHCQLVECMFGCTCQPSTSEITVTNNSLSAHTVNNLEVKAKRNLAKEEREFTQTLIHTDHDVILVGTGKVRRAPKVPKKYTDFINDIEEIFVNSSTSVSEQKSPLVLKNVDIPLEKLTLDEVIPFCLFHKTYNCFCKGNITVLPQGEKPRNESKSNEQIPKIRIVKTKEDQHKAWYDSCARIRKVFPEYKERNKNPLYNEKLRLKNMGKNRIGRPSKLDPPKVALRTSLEYEYDEMLVSLSKISDDVSKKASKRKQSFNIREEYAFNNPEKKEVKEFALQRRKKKMKEVPQPENLPPPVIPEPDLLLYNSIFDGEIKVPLKDNKEMLKIIGNENASLEYLRILPWTKLIENFQGRKICIWSKENAPTSALLCNAAGYLPPKNFIDIRKVQNKSEIIQWILTDQLPPDRPRNLMHLILTPKKNHFSIAGYCLKKMKDVDKTLGATLKTQTDNSFEGVSSGTNSSSTSPSDRTPRFHSILKKVNFPNDSGPSPKRMRSLLIVKNPEIGTSLKDIPISSHKEGMLSTDPLKHTTVTTSVKLMSKSEMKINVIPNLQELPWSTMVNSKSLEDKQVDKAGTSQQSVGKKKKANQEKTASLYEAEKESLLNLLNTQELNANLRRRLSDSDSVETVSFDTSTETDSKEPDDKTEEVVASKSNSGAVIPSRTLKCTHKNMYNKNKTLILTNKEFTKRNLYCDKDNKKAEIVAAPLPRLSKDCRWRMIYLNSDFTFLTFVEANYSIKYTDLMDVVKMSNNIRSTITLRNKEFSANYKHSMFGIFCVPDYQDRLFIGPYLPNERHNIETLRYLQGRLIDTQIFNKMVGKNCNEKSPVWVYETSAPTLASNEVIDITEDDENADVVELDSDNSEESIITQYLEDSLLSPPFVTELTREELKANRRINRFIMTNIPYLGYFGGCQKDSKSIEIYWPDNSRGYRFPNVTFAKHMMIQYLSQIFCPIPQSFKINVIIMTYVDPLTSKPVHPKYLKEPGPFFCGDFGVCERHNIPEDFVSVVPSIDSLLKQHRDPALNEDRMIRLFGLFLMSNEELRKHVETEEILEWATSEVYILRKLSENYESEKIDLKNIIQKNANLLKYMRMSVNIANVSETIEIKDSDEEEDPLADTESAVAGFKKISTSGRISSTPKTNKRSVLKQKLFVKPGRSLLRTENGEATHVKPVEISLKNSNIVLSSNKVLVTKIK